jgi:hypothetical protein
MAVTAALFYSDGYFAIDLYPGEPLVRVEDAPPVPDFDTSTPVLFSWDGELLERDEYRLLGVSVLHLDHVTAPDLEEIDRLTLPRVSIPQAGLIDVVVADVLRWAMKTYHGREAASLGWDPPITQEAG